MVRVLLLSVGSRGDAEPFCAIAQELLDMSTRVDLFLQSNLEYLADEYRENPYFQLFTFPFSSNDFYKVSTELGGMPSLNHPDPRMKHVGTVANVIRELVLPSLPQVLEVIDRSHDGQDEVVIVTSAFTRQLAFILAHARKYVKVVLLHLQPLLPNSYGPSYRTLRKDFVRVCVENYDHPTNVSREDEKSHQDSHWKIEYALEHFFLEEFTQQWFQNCFGGSLLPLGWVEIKQMLKGEHERVWIGNAYSNKLVPTLAGLPGIGSHVLDVGPLADGYIPLRQDEVNPSLAAFLSSRGEAKPMCIGFGSMPFQNVGVILEAIKTLRGKAVLVGDAFCQIPDSHPAIKYGRIFCISSVPYPLLLPHCSMMICHGGIGVVQSTLRAGIPCIVSPLMGDQFAWAELLEAKGYGVKCGSQLSKLTARDVVRAVQTSRLCIHACQKLAYEIQRDASAGPAKLTKFLLTLSEHQREERIEASNEQRGEL